MEGTPDRPGLARRSSALHRLAESIEVESGIRVSPSQLPLLQAAVTRFEPDVNAEEAVDHALDRKRGLRLIDRVIDAISVKETYFFRNTDELRALDWRALERCARAQGRERVRVWSVACATGEEAYTLAMLTLEAFLPRPAPVAILATDIARSAIRKAAAARYGKRAIRRVPTVLWERWLEDCENGSVVVSQRAREMVGVHRHNLISDAIPPGGEDGFDLCVCRNVLIYFAPETVLRTIAALERALAPGGVLVLGAADKLLSRRSPSPAERLPRPPQLDGARGVPRRLRTVPARPARTPDPDLGAGPLDPVPHYREGVRALSAQRPDHAIAALRRALYLDPTFTLAAFQLGRAHELGGDRFAGRRAYGQALRELSSGRGTRLAEAGQAQDIAAACRSRLAVLQD